MAIRSREERVDRRDGRERRCRGRRVVGRILIVSICSVLETWRISYS
jgi:hypothetical protein